MGLRKVKLLGKSQRGKGRDNFVVFCRSNGDFVIGHY